MCNLYILNAKIFQSILAERHRSVFWGSLLQRKRNKPAFFHAKLHRYLFTLVVMKNDLFLSSEICPLQYAGFDVFKMPWFGIPFIEFHALFWSFCPHVSSAFNFFPLFFSLRCDSFTCLSLPSLCFSISVCVFLSVFASSPCFLCFQFSFGLLSFHHICLPGLRFASLDCFCRRDLHLSWPCNFYIWNHWTIDPCLSSCVHIWVQLLRLLGTIMTFVA